MAVKDPGKYLMKTTELLQQRGFDDIKANLPDFEDPTAFTNQRSENEVMPDITARNRGGKHYFVLVRQKQSDPANLISRWKLFATMANMKQGEFHVLVPRGLLAYTRRLLTEYKINANIMKV